MRDVWCLNWEIGYVLALEAFRMEELDFCLKACIEVRYLFRLYFPRSNPRFLSSTVIWWIVVDDLHNILVDS